jgi:hypothetical protein
VDREEHHKLADAVSRFTLQATSAQSVGSATADTDTVQKQSRNEDGEVAVRDRSQRCRSSCDRAMLIPHQLQPALAPEA